MLALLSVREGVGERLSGASRRSSLVLLLFHLFIVFGLMMDQTFLHPSSALSPFFRAFD